MARRQACEWIDLAEAGRAFAAARGTQNAAHILRMHWYVACRLVVEGGFHPDAIKPRPPFEVIRRGRSLYLHYNDTAANWSEATVLGGLKTKKVDVVVALNGIGPCVAVSMKGTLNAFRNLTNRMEEAVGDCTNLHIAYPALVYAFLHLIRANREGPIDQLGSRFMTPVEGTSDTLQPADTCLRADGTVMNFIGTYHDTLARLTGRRDLRNEFTRYESVGLLLTNTEQGLFGQPVDAYPPADSRLHFSRFFSTIYEQYDLRFVYGAPNLKSVTTRHTWHPDSPALARGVHLEYTPRISPTDAAIEEAEARDTLPEDEGDS